MQFREVFIDKIDDNYYTVVRLPIHKLYDIIKDIEKIKEENHIDSFEINVSIWKIKGENTCRKK